MGQVIFIGDEITAAGFRLAGVECHTPEREELPKLLANKRDGYDLIMITAEYADWLGENDIEEMALWLRPLLSILPDIRNRLSPPNLEHAVRRELGIEA